MQKKALIVANLAGFLNFLWNDIATLQQMGYVVSVAVNAKLLDGSDAVETEKLKDMGIACHHVDFDTKNPLGKQNLKAFRQLQAILKNGYDVIHCHTPIAGILVRLAARPYRRKGTKVLYTTHGFSFNDRSSKKSWLVYHTTESMMSRFCDAIITINHEDYRNAQKMHCRKVYLIPSVGIDRKRFEAIQIDRDVYRESLGVGPDDIMVLAVGELSVRKNQQIIVKAIALLPHKERYVYVICGQAVVHSTVEEQLRQLGRDLGVRMQLLGHRLDIPEINACADVAVIPSLREGFGMAGVEALASGVPVAGSDTQGIREYVIPGKTGYLCDPNNEKQFAEAIGKLVSMTPEERRIMAQECRNTAQNFDVERSTQAMKDIYQEVLKG